MNASLSATLPFAIIFLSLFGTMIFLATYIHFPKMEERKRVMTSITNAIVLILSLAVLMYIFLVLCLPSLTAIAAVVL